MRRRGAPFGAPAAVLRARIDSWDVVDHVGAVCLAGASPSVRFGRPVMAAHAVFCVCVTNERGPTVSKRERE